MSFLEGLTRFAVFAFLGTAGVLWMHEVTLPHIAGLHMTRENLVFAIVMASPAFICFIGGWIATHIE